MAVVPVLLPDTYALTKGGRMRYRFSGSSRYETTGVRARCTLSITAPVPDGTIVKLRWNGQTQILTARTVPALPTDFPAGDGSSAYGDQLAAYFKSYFPFRADFTVSRVDFGVWPLVILTARKTGTAYNLSLILPPAIATLPPAQGPISLGIDTPGADPLIRERYGVYVELYLQRAGTPGLTDSDFDLVETAHVECDADGLADYDVGDVLHGYLSADLPNVTTTSGHLAQHSHRAYYLAYGEAWGSPIRPGKIVDDTIRQAYLGGADFAHQADAGFNLATFVKADQPSGDRALRFGGSTRVVRLDEPQFLSFINLRGDDSVFLQVILTFDDDSTQAMARPAGIQNPVAFAPGSKIDFAVGISALQLLAQVPVGRFLKEYQVNLFGNQGVRSRSYRYVVDYVQKPYRRFFVFLNSLGGWSSLMTHGKGSAELLRFYDQAERFLLSGYDPKEAQYVDYNLARQQQIEVASGWQPLPELAHWEDFYISPLRLQVSGTQMFAIGLTSKSIKQQKDGDTQFAHVFQYVYLHRDEFYTDTLTLEGDETLPVIEMPAGTVVVLPQQPIPTIDPTIPQAVRELTTADIQSFKTVAARPNPETLGFLTQTSGSALFRSKDQKVSYLNDLTDKPTTRDQAGIMDVPTIPDLFHIIHIKPHLTSWTGEEEPSEPI